MNNFSDNKIFKYIYYSGILPLLLQWTQYNCAQRYKNCATIIQQLCSKIQELGTLGKPNKMFIETSLFCHFHTALCISNLLI